MNLNTFEQKQNETMVPIHLEGDPSGGGSDAFVTSEAHNLKQKIEKRKGKQKQLRRFIGGMITLVVVLALGFGYSQYKLYTLSKEELATGAVSLASSTPKTPEEILKAVGRHILLPEGSPQIAEVQDVEKLRETQAFFRNARNGDIVIVYPFTIFIYRPADDIVVASGDILGTGEAKP